MPDRVVPVTAAGDGFLLTPDQGEVFYESAGGDLENWVRLAREAALLQRDLVPHHAALMEVGMAQLRPEESADYVAARVEQYATLPPRDPRRLAPEVAERLHAHLPVVRRWAEQVAALGLPLTLNHNDLHENNVFDVDGRLRFFDFGDALVTEPLAVLLIPLNILGEKLAADGEDPRLWRVVDAALEVWSDLVPATELRDATGGPPARPDRPRGVVGALSALAVGRAAGRVGPGRGDLAGHARRRSAGARQGQQDARGLTPR